jgi:cell division protein FtsX
MSKLDQADRNAIPAKEYAFPKEKKEPLEDAAHVRNAIARFNQVKGVTDAERDEAWERIRRAAKRFGVEMHEAGWRDLQGEK